MATFNTYQQPAAETPLARKWFIWALAGSLALHAVLYFALRSTKLESFTPYTERLVPRAFTSLGRVQVDEKLILDDTDKKPAEQQPPTPPAPNIADVPQDKPTIDSNPQDLVYTPTAPEASNPIAHENPAVTNTDIKTLANMQDSVSHDLDKDLNKLSEQLIKDKSQANTKPLLQFSENTHPGGTANPAGGEAAIPGTKSLDAALSNTGGGLQNGDKIGIHGGALFEYDSADLRPEAMNELKKLAAIVKKYPGAIFSIEGYADSFGTPEYNLDLSQRRADTVKSWLLLTVGVNPNRIEAKGYGSTKYVVPPTGTVEEQEKNRRVEIGIKFPH